jgi:transcriptional regulator with XRE-family HTH domain
MELRKLKPKIVAPSNPNLIVGKKLRLLRDRCQITQEELLTQTNIKLSKNGFDPMPERGNATISYLENGARKLGYVEAIAMIGVLNEFRESRGGQLLDLNCLSPF